MGVLAYADDVTLLAPTPCGTCLKYVKSMERGFLLYSICYSTSVLFSLGYSQPEYLSCAMPQNCSASNKQDETTEMFNCRGGEREL